MTVNHIIIWFPKRRSKSGWGADHESIRATHVIVVRFVFYPK